MSELPIGGIVPFSASDYPGCLALVVFCQGCPWRCHYCHNPHLQSFSVKTGWKGVVALLQRRRGLLDAIVFSGGEPTAHKGLLSAVKEAKSLHFKVGLHTGGNYPKNLKEILPFVNWVGFDIKAPFDKYEAITQVAKSGERARASAELLLEKGIACEFRTTFHPKLLTNADVEAIGKSLSAMGVKTYVLQEFHKEGCNNKTLVQTMPLAGIEESLRTKLEKQFATFLVR